LTVSININQSGLVASNITRGLERLTPTDRARLIAVFDPLILTLAMTMQDAPGKFGIADPKTRDTIMASLLLIQTSLNVVKITLAGGN